MLPDESANEVLSVIRYCFLNSLCIAEVSSLSSLASCICIMWLPHLESLQPKENGSLKGFDICCSIKLCKSVIKSDDQQLIHMRLQICKAPSYNYLYSNYWQLFSIWNTLCMQNLQSQLSFILKASASSYKHHLRHQYRKKHLFAM